MKKIDMSVGGWDGWCYASWGRAKKWRIYAPNGESFYPDELLSVRQNERDIGYLQSQIKRLRAMQLPVTRDDFMTVEAAYFILQGLLTMYSPEITNTVFERRTAPRAFNLSLYYKAVSGQASK